MERDYAFVEGCGGGSGWYYARPGNPVRCVLSFFFCSRCLIFFVQSYPVDQGVQLEEKWCREHQRVVTSQPPAISVFVFAFFVHWGRVSFSFSCVIPSPTSKMGLTIYRRSSVWFILVIHKASSGSVGATSLRSTPRGQRTRVGCQTMYCCP